MDVSPRLGLLGVRLERSVIDRGKRNVENILKLHEYYTRNTSRPSRIKSIYICTNVRNKRCLSVSFLVVQIRKRLCRRTFITSLPLIHHWCRFRFNRERIRS